MELKIDYVANKEKNVKSKKFRKMYKNLNFALQEIMKDASIIGESEDLTSDYFDGLFEVKIGKEMDSPSQIYCSDEESVNKEESSALQSDESFNFNSSDLLPINSHVNPVQNLKPPLLDSSECGPVNLRIKYTDNFDEVAVKCDTIKCVAKYSSPELKNESSKYSSNCGKILVNMKSNPRKLYKCHEPLCCFFTLDISDFKKHNLMHFKYKLKERTEFNNILQRKPIPDPRYKFEMESNPPVEHILHSFDGTDGNSLIDKTVNCSLCDFFCFTPIGLKRHYNRYHSNSEMQELSEELKYCENDCTNSSDASLNGEDQHERCSYCSFECRSSSFLRKHEQEHHQTVDDGLIGTSKNLKCFECTFETPHRITLIRHEKKHANFINKSKIKYNVSHSLKKNCKMPRKNALTVSSLNFQSTKPILDEHCNLERIVDQQNGNKFNQNETKQNFKAGCDNVDKCLDEYQPFRVNFDFKEKKEYPTVDHQKIIMTSSEEKTKYKKLGNSYRCKICSYKTRQKHYIKQHILMHLEEKLLKCTQCSYATNIEWNLQRHKWTHQKTKKYSCKLCDFQSSFEQRMRSHCEQFHRPEVSHT